ncbi:MAG: hypothetical protein KF690_06255, partial [Bacteroidetes bacterium]|nr:hypothetical protein [Bacteroidota bacterium]
MTTQTQPAYLSMEPDYLPSLTDAPRGSLVSLWRQRLRLRSWRLASYIVLGLLIGALAWVLSPDEAVGEPLNLREHVATVKLELSLQQKLKSLMAAPEALADFLPEPLWVPALTSAHYRADRGLVWVRPGGLTAHGRQLLTSLQDAGEAGLLPRDYHLPLLDTLAKKLTLDPDPQQYLRTEFLLTDAFFLYSRHLRTGKLDSTAWMPYWDVPGTDTTLAYGNLLVRVQNSSQPLDSLFAQWLPRHPEYWQLRRAMRTHLAWQKAGVRWPKVPPVDKLEPGQR